jgi:predicted double-glycine peptidase
MSRKREKILMMVFVSGFVVYYSVMPFLGPMFVRGELKRLKTEMDKDGVCRQGTDYTCGPAAAVTALKCLKVPAEEGQLAIASHTSSYGGTPGDSLALAIRDLYGREGVVCDYRLFKSVSEMKEICPVIAQVKFRFLIDHFVAVLQVTDKYVIVGDPLFGRYKHSRRDFESIWRYSGVVVCRK